MIVMYSVVLDSLFELLMSRFKKSFKAEVEESSDVTGIFTDTDSSGVFVEIDFLSLSGMIVREVTRRAIVVAISRRISYSVESKFFMNDCTMDSQSSNFFGRI